MKPLRIKHLYLVSLTGLLLFGLLLSTLGRTGANAQFEPGFDIRQRVEAQRLLSKVGEEGQIRVIVELDISFKPEGKLHSSAAVARQRMGILQAQHGLVNRLNLDEDQNIRRFKYVPQMAMGVNASQLAALLNDPAVLRVHEDELLAPSLISSVPYIGGEDAWAAGFLGAGQVVAILDTGVDAGHEFLAEKIVSEACYSNAYPPDGGTTLCPNGLQEQVGPGSAAPCAICDHGTHVAGIAVGKGALFSGVAPDAKLIAIQVFTLFTDPTCSDFGLASPCALTYFSDVAMGLERVYALRDTFNIASVNLSLGGGHNSAPCPGDITALSIINLRSVNIATVVASGNDGYTDGIGTPACVPAAISVASTNLSDNVSSFSSVASFLDFFAPGHAINSSEPGGVYGYKQGTSMAAPHVAGAWAVIKSKIPDGSVDFIKSVLSSTGVLVDDNRGGGSVTDIPRIQLDAAIDKITLNLLPILIHQAEP